VGYYGRLIGCVVASLLLHTLTGRALEQLPDRDDARPSYVVQMTVKTPEPEPPPEPKPAPDPEPEPEPETVHEVPEQTPKPPPPKPKKRKRPRKKKLKTPPNSEAKPDQETTDTPVFGFNLASTSSGGSGPSMPVGNTVMGDPDKMAKKPARKVRALAAPVPAFEVTEMPKMVGRCRGAYTEKARESGVEGTVLLSLIVGVDGRTREIKVVKGLGHGLDEAAIQALAACRFKPGKRNGKAVAVRLRSFKIRFFLDEDA
jgi:protein TonB